jgi:predicted nucleotidyltransferase
MALAPALVQHRLETLGATLSAACPAIRFAYLFGSAATGQLGPSSDVDIAIYVDPQEDVARCRLEAARVTASHLGIDEIDLVALNSAPLSVTGRILATRRILLDRDPFLRHRYESLTARMYQDFRIREHRLLARRFGHG